MTKSNKPFYKKWRYIVPAILVLVFVIFPVGVMVLDPDGFAETQQKVEQERADKEALEATQEAEEQASEEAREAEEKASEDAKEAERIVQEEAEEQERLEAEEQASLEASILTVTDVGMICEAFGEEIFPYGFTSHYIMGVIGGRETEDGNYFLKTEATVTNQYGAEMKATMECEVSGTRDSHAVEYFDVY